MKTRSYDLWEDEEICTKSRRSKVHPSQKRCKKPDLPHPGQSYNPDPEDHQRLLNKILKKEIAYQKKHNVQPTPKVDPVEVIQSDRQDLVSGIEHLITGAKQEHESETDAAFSDYDEKDFEFLANKAKQLAKQQQKTRQQRARQLKDRLQRREAKLRKLKNKKSAISIKKLVKQLDKTDKEREAEKKKRRKRRRTPESEQPDPVFCFKRDLPKSLRLASCPMSSLLRSRDRFR